MRAHFVLSAKTADTGEIVGFLRPQPAMAASGQRRPPSDASAECLAPGGKWLQELSYQRAWQFGGPIFDDRRRPSCRAIPEAEVRTSMEPTKEQPGVVANGRAKALSRSCQMDQVSLASVMMRLHVSGPVGSVTTYLAGSDQETRLSIRYARSVVVEFFVETTA